MIVIFKFQLDHLSIPLVVRNDVTCKVFKQIPIHMMVATMVILLIHESNVSPVVFQLFWYCI